VWGAVPPRAYAAEAIEALIAALRGELRIG
jgi:hypothetical protein